MTDQPAPDDILKLAQQFRTALARHDKRALNRLIDAYGRVYTRLQDKIDLLVDAIGMNEPTAGQLVKMNRYTSLIKQVKSELTDYQVLLRNEIEAVSRDAILFSSRDTARMLAAMGTDFNRLPNEAIHTLLGFLDRDGPLYERIGKLAGVNAEYVADKIVEGISLGQNPRQVAALIRDSLGNGLTDALRMTRTVQIWSYREATRANYLNNSDVIEGWIWWADLGGDPCMACIAEHGTFHTLDETLDDHYNGRCTMLPVVQGYPNVIEQSGEDWFNNLSEQKQRELMGGGKYDAWKDGQFSFDKLASRHDDEVYGTMTTEATLKDLIANE